MSKSTEIINQALKLAPGSQIVLRFKTEKEFFSTKTLLHLAKKSLGANTVRIKTFSNNKITLHLYDPAEDQKGFDISTEEIPEPQSEETINPEDVHFFNSLPQPKKRSPKPAELEILSLEQEKQKIFDSNTALIKDKGYDHFMDLQLTPGSDQFINFSKVAQLNTLIAEIRKENKIPVPREATSLEAYRAQQKALDDQAKKEEREFNERKAASNLEEN